MTPQIIDKITKEIELGLNTEAQVVYFLSGIRKIIEQENLKDTYPYLAFHCNWALHSRLRGRDVQRILTEFHSYQIQILSRLEVTKSKEILNISGLTQLKSECKNLLLNKNVGENVFKKIDWNRFHYLYAKIVEDSPLQINEHNVDSEISQIIVTAKLDGMSNNVLQHFKVFWHLDYRNGQKRTLKSYRSFVTYEDVE